MGAGMVRRIYDTHGIQTLRGLPDPCEAKTLPARDLLRLVVVSLITVLQKSHYKHREKVYEKGKL
jgi:hypothetical protein